MTFNPCVIGYVPPPLISCAEAFHKNITAFKTAFPLVLFSDHAGWGLPHYCANPDRIKNQRRKWACNNLVLLFSLTLAKDLGYSHMLYLEDDCRVRGDYWDRRVFEEFSSVCPDAKVAGTPVLWNIGSMGSAMQMRAIEWAHDYQVSTGIACGIYGCSTPVRGVPTELMAYCNGALGIYEVEWLLSIFPGYRANIGQFALNADAFDMCVGRELISRHGPDAFKLCGQLTSVFSGYGDTILDYNQRVNLLTSGTCVAIHQVKSQDALLP